MSEPLQAFSEIFANKVAANWKSQAVVSDTTVSSRIAFLLTAAFDRAATRNLRFVAGEPFSSGTDLLSLIPRAEQVPQGVLRQHQFTIEGVAIMRGGCLDSLPLTDADLESTEQSHENLPPTPVEMFIPPLPVPASIRGFHLVAAFDVEETGHVELIEFSHTGDSAYDRKLEAILRRFRFRPGTTLDGTPVKLRTTLVLDLY